MRHTTVEWTYRDVDDALDFLHLAEEGLEQGGFPGADLPDDRDRRPRRDPQVDVPQDRGVFRRPGESPVRDENCASVCPFTFPFFTFNLLWLIPRKCGFGFYDEAD